MKTYCMKTQFMTSRLGYRRKRMSRNMLPGEGF